MSTINDVLTQQEKHHILAAPSKKVPAAATNDTTTFNLYNSTTTNTVYAYVTGIAINNNSSTYLLEADGVTPCMFPENATSSFRNCISIYDIMLPHYLEKYVLNI